MYFIFKILKIFGFRPDEFNANLKLWLKRIMHETDEVRIRALKHLKIFLAEHRSELNKMILSETDVHPLIVEVCLLHIIQIYCACILHYYLCIV